MKILILRCLWIIKIRSPCSHQANLLDLVNRHNTKYKYKFTQKNTRITNNRFRHSGWPYFRFSEGWKPYIVVKETHLLFILLSQVSSSILFKPRSITLINISYIVYIIYQQEKIVTKFKCKFCELHFSTR